MVTEFDHYTDRCPSRRMPYFTRGEVWAAATTPLSLRTASRNFEPSRPEACEEAMTNTTTSTSGMAGRTRYTLWPPSYVSRQANSARTTRRAPLEGTALENVGQGGCLPTPSLSYFSPVSGRLLTACKGRENFSFERIPCACAS